MSISPEGEALEAQPVRSHLFEKWFTAEVHYALTRGRGLGNRAEDHGVLKSLAEQLDLLEPYRPQH